MIKQCLFLLIIFCLTSFAQAELQVWAYKGIAKIDGKQVEINQQIDENTKLILQNNESYVAFYNLQNNKIIEVLGEKYLNYSDLKKIEEKSIELPLVISELITHKRPVYRGCRCTSRPTNYASYPKDKISFKITEEDDFIFLWQKQKILDATKMDSIIYVMNLGNQVLMEIPFQKGENVIKTDFSKLFPKARNALLFKVGDDAPKIIELITDSSHVIFEQKEVLKKLKSTDLFAHKVYAMLWAYQQDLFVDGYLLFEELNNLPDYKGFDEYYQQLYWYYIKEKKKRNEH